MVSPQKADGGNANVKLNPWDSKTQQYHGGQEWSKIAQFVEDFSVTTNCYGTPQSGLDAVANSIHNIHHYPPADQEPAKSDLARFLWPSDEEFDANHGRLLMGNGASELIDLVIRLSPEGTWKPGPWDVQYMEYQRSAATNSRTILAPKAAEPATLTCIVNPNNPTGEYMDIDALKAWIRTNVEDNGVVVLDESMQPWHSADWRSQSMTSQHDFVAEMLRERNVRVYVIHSWTKLWCCTGLRIGSIVSPTAEHTAQLKKFQVPWSVNSLALPFMSAVVRDDDFVNKTWNNTAKWRAAQIEVLTQVSKDMKAKFGTHEWEFHGQDFLSWIWIDVKDARVADVLVEAARVAGTPVRAGKYGMSGRRMSASRLDCPTS
ncbi:pyridoxal phosphate-dependent transferase [Catenaria anguillulae PL171]|uniref:Pyridoxal phosphate-dependent transferase n=1 Tax=Catenaria anguillulae PL171 TaxID=765915 RepID=A0A1Y2HK82_9FUNG|nr:pyridoxal phosphate-dependent transferase [Catenaria anguillulae PL171]